MLDYLALEPDLIARIQAELPDLRMVHAGADLAGMSEAQQITPSVHVLYQGDDVATGSGGRGDTGVPQKITQTWLAIVATRNARSQRSGSAARELAGPLLTQLVQALAGWQPDDAAFAPLKRVNAPAPAYTPGGFAYFPTAWTTEFYT